MPLCSVLFCRVVLVGWGWHRARTDARYYTCARPLYYVHNSGHEVLPLKQAPDYKCYNQY